MDLNNRRELRATAEQRLRSSDSAPKISLIYAGIVTLVTLVSTTVSFILGEQVSRFGGLSNMGMRSILSSLQTMLPIAGNLFLMPLTLGFVGTMLRVSRGQFASPQGMKIGFDRFWVLLRATLLQSLLYLLAAVVVSQISFSLFLMTPLSRNFMNFVMALSSPGADVNALLADPNLESSLMQSLVPGILLTLALSLVVVIPLFFRYRMVNYILLDKPGTGAFAAMRQSAMMMRKKHLALFKLDLGFWWYYLAGIVASLVCYGDMLLPLIGVPIPFSPTVSFFVFFFAYLLINLAITVYLRPYVEVTYAGAYEAIRPRETTGGAVLGNIFQL